MTNIVALTAANARRWADAKIAPNLAHFINGVAHRLVTAKPRYQSVEARTGVPWFITAVIHERESSQSWSANLANGDRWDRPTIHVPAHRGPFKSWEDAAVDALVNCSPHVARNTDWTVGGALTELESYNGLGYANHGIASPYLWASTDQYRSGKYIADGHFDPNAVDHQIGCAGLLRSMISIDPTIQFKEAA
jgi:lysozyme family protein